MTYELAKKLKDAGFPQVNATRFSYYEDSHGNSMAFSNGEGGVFQPTFKEKVFFPTLPELIEACGDRFESLYRRVDKEYKTLGWATYPFGGFGSITGETPEEAVANLWLKLNEK